jgi:hypothetical protein
MLDSQMAQEKSYDSLPNFTAGKYIISLIQKAVRK